MSSFKVEQMTESVMNLVGKNLFHCKDTNMLFWCDVLGGQVCCMDLNNHNKMSMFRLMGEKVICFCVPIHGKKDQFIVGAGRRLLHVTWDRVHTMGQIMKVLGEVPVTGVRMNTCRVDKQGRLFFGTMISEEQGDVLDLHKRIGCLYRYTMHDGLVQIKDNIGLSNGMAWNSTWTKMYFVDSFDMNVYEFDYDIKTGNITNQKVLLDVTSWGQMKKVFPGSMTIDHDDNIFVVMFGGAKIIKINTKTHKVEHEMKMNVHQLTGCEFGGKNMDMMYVTTAAMDTFCQQTYPSGYLMKVTNLGTHGTHMHKFVMN